MEVDNQLIAFYMHIFLIIVVFGLACFLRFAYPRFINDREGFRTKVSMKNEDTWIEANRYYGKTVLIFAFIWCFISSILHFILIKYLTLLLLVTANSMIIVFLVPSRLTEKYLDKTFDDRGVRK
jgi:uncharacterized membrane protein